MLDGMLSSEEPVQENKREFYVQAVCHVYDQRSSFKTQGCGSYTMLLSKGTCSPTVRANARLLSPAKRNRKENIQYAVDAYLAQN